MGPSNTDAVSQGSTTRIEPPNWGKRVFGIGQPGKSAARDHLLSSIRAVKAEIETHAAGPNRANVDRLLRDAGELAKTAPLSAGWKLLNAAQRVAVEELSDAERRAVARTILTESKAEQKLNRWRRDLVRELLEGDPPHPMNVVTSDPIVAVTVTSVAKEPGSTPSPSTPPPEPPDTATHRGRVRFDKESVQAAMLVLEEGKQNIHRKTELFVGQASVLLRWLIFGTAAFVVLSSLTTMLATDSRLQLVAVCLMGVLGGSFSALTQLSAEVGKSRRIPEQFLDGAVTSLRPVLGAAGALAAWLFLKSGIVALGDAPEAKTLAIAFAAGFSDRVVLRGVGAVTGGDQGSKPTT